MLELPLAHIIQQNYIYAGYFEYIIKLVIDMVNFYRNKFDTLFVPGFFDDFSKLRLKIFT